MFCQPLAGGLEECRALVHPRSCQIPVVVTGSQGWTLAIEFLFDSPPVLTVFWPGLGNPGGSSLIAVELAPSRLGGVLPLIFTIFDTPSSTVLRRPSTILPAWQGVCWSYCVARWDPASRLSCLCGGIRVSPFQYFTVSQV